MKNFSFKIKKAANEIYFVSPNDLGHPKLNNWYKWITHFFKTAPFLVVVPLSILMAILIYLIFRKMVINLVSLLQYGF